MRERAGRDAPNSQTRLDPRSASFQIGAHTLLVRMTLVRTPSRAGARLRIARVAALGGIALALALSGCGSTHQAAPTSRATEPVAPASPATGSVVLSNTTWHCRSSVDLTLVRVTLHDQSMDAVHLDRGCNGTIKRLEVVGDGSGVGPGGDAVKVHNGAHDLRILGGMIDCGEKGPAKHQDAIQAMGGRNVIFEGIDSRYCSNSFMFINSGRNRRGLPTQVQCIKCTAATRNYSVFVGRSVDSGAQRSTFMSRVPPRTTASAVRAVLQNNEWTRRQS